MQTSATPRLVRLSQALYPRLAITQAREAFSQVCQVAEEEAGADVLVTITPLEGAPPETAEEFLSYALSAALEAHLAQLD